MPAPQSQPEPASVTRPLSLRALLDAHPVALVIDAASARVQTGLLPRSGGARWESAETEAGAAIFSGVEKLLARALLRLDDVAAFVFCDGPGYVLGIRTAAVAIRSWNVLRPRPVYSYCSLELVARALAQAENARDFAVIADARRDTWHRVAVDATGNISPLQRVPAAGLGDAGAAGEIPNPKSQIPKKSQETNPKSQKADAQCAGDSLGFGISESGICERRRTIVMPAHFRHWSPLPAPAGHIRSVPYSLADLLPPLADAPLFAPALAPDAFLHEEPAYKTWTPQIHRRPAIPLRGKETSDKRQEASDK
jgi:tRNA threonylcarbamoyladenosine biosynthesis protein TsaB